MKIIVDEMPVSVMNVRFVKWIMENIFVVEVT